MTSFGENDQASLKKEMDVPRSGAVEVGSFRNLKLGFLEEMDAPKSTFRGATKRNEDAMTNTLCQTEAKEEYAADDDLTETDFLIFGRKILFFQLVFTIASAFYIWLMSNELHVFNCVCIVQFWFVLLLCSAHFPLGGQHGRWERVLSGVMVLSVPLVLSVLQTIELVGWGSSMRDLFFILMYKLLIIGMGTLALVASWSILICVRKVYKDDPKKLYKVATQSIEKIMKAGIVQTALLTIALVGYKTSTLKEVYASMSAICYFNGNCGYRYYSHTIDSLEEAEHIYEGFVAGLQATLVGLVINLGLMQWLVTKHISKVKLVHLLQRRVSFRNYAAALLQLVVFCSAAAIAALDPSQVGPALSEFNHFHKLLVYGIAIPSALLVCMLLYYCWSKTKQAWIHGPSDGDTASLVSGPSEGDSHSLKDLERNA